MFSRNSTLSSMLCFIFVFFSIFGMKISYLDLSIILPCTIVLFHVTIKRPINLNKEILNGAGLISILLTYQIIVQLFYLEFDFDSLLRLGRALLMCILFSVMVGSSLFSHKQILNAVFYSLLLHVILIDAAALFDPLNNFLSSISGNDRVKPLRASGFLAGFDIAGLLCLFGLLMLLLKLYIPASNFNLIIFYFLFVLGSFFTSRVSMALVVMAVCFYIFLKIFSAKTRLRSKLTLATMASIFIYFFVVQYLVPIAEVTFSLGAFYVSNELRGEIISRHATQSTESFLWSNMFYLPKSFVATIFGMGVDEPNSDVGYVKDIFRYGVIGLLFSFVIYYYIYRIGRTSLRLSTDKHHLSMLRIVFVLVLVLTLKNNYFFTRAVFPFILLLVCIPVVRRGHARSL